MKHLALLLALTTIPAHAGGPVLVQEETTEAAPARDNGWLLPVIGLLIVGALIASGGGDDAAPADPGPGPKPQPEPCVFNGDGC
jgi:hypothetical protein